MKRSLPLLALLFALSGLHPSVAAAAGTPPLPAGGTYAVITRYKGVDYGVAVSAKQATRPFEMPVYDTTTSDANLMAPSVLVAVRRTGSGLAVMEQWTLANPTDYTHV